VIVDIAKANRIEDEVARRGGLGLKRFGAELVGPCPQCGGIDLAIPTEFADVYVALGWRLIYEGCCGLAHIMPPVPVTPARSPRWRTAR
jgi:hypothetical protein